MLLIRCLAWLALFACTAAGAATELKIDVGPTACGSADARGRPGFRYTATWASATLTKHYVNTGNGCRLGSAPCGVSNKVCAVPCSGTCSVTLDSCPRGASWVQVGTADRSAISRRVPAPPPDLGKCG